MKKFLCSFIISLLLVHAGVSARCCKKTKANGASDTCDNSIVLQQCKQTNGRLKTIGTVFKTNNGSGVIAEVDENGMCVKCGHSQFDHYCNQSGAQITDTQNYPTVVIGNCPS